MIINKKLAALKAPMKLKFRVKSLLPDNKNPTSMILVPFVNSRDVQDRFDEVLGADNWTDEYFEVKGKQFCKIGVRIGGEWIYKSDSGAESYKIENFDPSDSSKGETSDSFKRAAVKWGVNRDAYQLGEIKIACKLQDGIPKACNASGQIISGADILEECIRLAASKDQDLVFDRNVLPATPSTLKDEKPAAKKRSSSKPKVILP